MPSGGAAESAARTTGTTLDRRYRNFDALRLIAAGTVVVTHAFELGRRTDSSDPLVLLLGPHELLGVYGVYVFFIISGFLITRSFMRRRSLAGYLTRRVLRIFPALIVSVLACAFVVGPALTQWPLRAYLTHHHLYWSVEHTLRLYGGGDWTLPGVVFTGNAFGKIVNGSLWTLGPEFTCYLGVAILGLAGLLRPATVVGLLVAGALAGQPSLAFAVFGAVLVIALGTAARPRLPDVTRFGDLSYGTYIFAWPIQALVRHFIGADPWLGLLVSTPIILIVAWASWHAVEGPALRAASWVTATVDRLGSQSRARLAVLART